MPAQKLTDRTVKSLVATDGKRVEIMDEEASGLCLRVTPNGVRSWSFLFRPRGSPTKKRYGIGDYPAWSLKDAREEALRLRRAVQEGRDPVVDRKRAADELTLAKVLERFVAGARKRGLRSADDYDALLKRRVVPKLGGRKASDIQRADVANLLDEIAVEAPVTANRVQAVLSSAFTWAMNDGLVPANPILRLSKRTKEEAKERVLTADEIRNLWLALDEMAPAYRDTLRLILLTGQRPGECAGITAEEIDLEKALWIIPAARAKNKRLHAVPLVGEALTIVKGLAHGRKRGPLIVTPRGAELTPQNLAKAFERIPEGTLDTDATPHDLRRTAATLLAGMGIDRLHVAAVLNHASTTKATVTGAVYDQHSYLPEKRRALEALASEIERIVSGRKPADNVVELRAHGEHQ